MCGRFSTQLAFSSFVFLMDYSSGYAENSCTSSNHEINALRDENSTYLLN